MNEIIFAPGRDPNKIKFMCSSLVMTLSIEEVTHVCYDPDPYIRFLMLISKGVVKEALDILEKDPVPMFSRLAQILKQQSIDWPSLVNNKDIKMNFINNIVNQGFFSDHNMKILKESKNIHKTGWNFFVGQLIFLLDVPTINEYSENEERGYKIPITRYLIQQQIF